MIVTRHPTGPFKAVEIAPSPWWIGGTVWAVVDRYGHVPADVIADAASMPRGEDWCRRRAAQLNEDYYRPHPALIAEGPD